LDKKEIVKRLLLEPVDWVSLTPLILGATLGLGAWAISLESGLAIAVSVILLLLSVGIYLNRLIFGWNENYERIVREWRASVERERDRKLDQLYRDLQTDGDPRTETLLKDLRTLTSTLMSEQDNHLASGAFGILSDVDKLFTRCVGYLEESLKLWRTAEAVERKNIADELLAQRKVLIDEVEKSLDRLGDVLGGIKKAALSRDGEELNQLREELKSRLKIAEEVENRIRRMQGGVSDQDQRKYLDYADK
jgi:hypothetical protein